MARDVQETVDDAREVREDSEGQSAEVECDGHVKAVEVRRELQSAEVCMRKRERDESETRRRGWRSRAFDA